ncbi:MAG: hypothetical protein WCK31_05120, partial [bacterium]
MEVIGEPKNEGDSLTAYAVNAVDFLIQRCGNSLGGDISMRPEDSFSLSGSLFGSDTMLDLDEVEKAYRESKRQARCGAKEEGKGINFIRLALAAGNKNFKGLVLYPSGFSIEFTQQVINHALIEQTRGFGQSTEGAPDTVSVNLEYDDKRRRLVEVSGLSKLKTDGTRKPSTLVQNLEYLQPSVQMAEWMTLRASELMQYMVVNRKDLETVKDFYGVEGKVLSAIANDYIRFGDKEKLGMSQLDNSVTEIIKLVLSYLPGHTIRGGNSDEQVIPLGKAVEEFNNHKSPFREATIRKVLSGFMLTILRLNDAYSEATIVDKGILKNPNLDSILLNRGIDQRTVTKTLRSMNCVNTFDPKNDSEI